MRQQLSKGLYTGPYNFIKNLLTAKSNDFKSLTKSDLKSLDFAVNRFLMKLFRSNNIEIIAECCRYFHFNLPSELIEKRKLNSKKTIADVC